MNQQGDSETLPANDLCAMSVIHIRFETKLSDADTADHDIDRMHNFINVNPNDVRHVFA